MVNSSLHSFLRVLMLRQCLMLGIMFCVCQGAFFKAAFNQARPGAAEPFCNVRRACLIHADRAQCFSQPPAESTFSCERCLKWGKGVAGKKAMG